MLWAVIMAGGSGTRFWPESRTKKPKQFLKIFGRQTLLEQTVLRLRPLIPRERIIVVTQKRNVSLVRRLTHIPSAQIIGEPVGRNTAPCAALAAAIAMRKDPGAVLAILPSDHHIDDASGFRRVLRVAGEMAGEKSLPVTFGIRPTFPHTGFGYLEMGAFVEKRGGVSVCRLRRFCEKPDALTAKKFFKTKRYLWNGGIFIWRADALLRSVKAHQPRIDRLLKRILRGPFGKQMNRFFSQMPNISIDYGLMEKLGGKILTVPLSVGWNDLGGWQVFPEIWPKDKRGNVVLGKVILEESTGNIVKAGPRLVALLGVQDLVVVDTEDALLVCPKHKTESVRSIVDELRKRKWKEYL